jgi:hypothetical protein
VVLVDWPPSNISLGPVSSEKSKSSIIFGMFSSFGSVLTPGLMNCWFLKLSELLASSLIKAADCNLKVVGVGSCMAWLG